MPELEPRFNIQIEVASVQAATQLRAGNEVIVTMPERVFRAIIKPVTTGESPIFEVLIDRDGQLPKTFHTPEDAMDAAVTYLRETAL